MNVWAVHLYPCRFLGVVGYNEGELPIEQKVRVDDQQSIMTTGS